MSTETEKAAPAATPAPVTCGRSYDCGEPSGFALFVGRFAIFFALVAIVFYGLGYLFRGGSSVETPDFDDFGPDLIASTKQANESEGGANVDTPEVKALREKWQPKVAKEYARLATKMGEGDKPDAKELDNKAKRFFETALKGASQLPSAEMDKDDLEDLVEEYVEGAYDCFRSFVDFYSKDKFGKDPDKYLDPVLNDYHAKFAKSVEQAAKDEKDTAEKDAERAKIVTNAMFLLVFAAMIPLLAKIERNTRRG